MEDILACLFMIEKKGVIFGKVGEGRAGEKGDMVYSP